MGIIEHGFDHKKRRTATYGITVSEAGTAFMKMAGVSDAVIDAQEAKRRGDWDAYEDACDRMTDAELEKESKGQNPMAVPDADTMPAYYS